MSGIDSKNTRSAWGSRGACTTLFLLPSVWVAYAQDKERPHPKELEGEYQLTKTTADKSDIRHGGLVIVLHKDNVLMLVATSTNPAGILQGRQGHAKAQPAGPTKR